MSLTFWPRARSAGPFCMGTRSWCGGMRSNFQKARREGANRNSVNQWHQRISIDDWVFDVDRIASDSFMWAETRSAYEESCLNELRGHV